MEKKVLLNPMVEYKNYTMSLDRSCGGGVVWGGNTDERLFSWKGSGD